MFYDIPAPLHQLSCQMWKIMFSDAYNCIQALKNNLVLFLNKKNK